MLTTKFFCIDNKVSFRGLSGNRCCCTMLKPLWEDVLEDLCSKMTCGNATCKTTQLPYLSFKNHVVAKPIQTCSSEARACLLAFLSCLVKLWSLLFQMSQKCLQH